MDEGAKLSHWEVLKNIFKKMFAFYLNIKIYTGKKDLCRFLFFKELLSLGLGWANVGGLMFNIVIDKQSFFIFLSKQFSH